MVIAARTGDAAALHVLGANGAISAFESDGSLRNTVFTDDQLDSRYVGIANYKGELLLLSNDGNIDDFHPELGYRTNPFTHLGGFAGYRGLAFDPVSETLLLLNPNAVIEARDSNGTMVYQHPFHGVAVDSTARDITYDSVHHRIMALNERGRVIAYDALGNVIPTEFDGTHEVVDMATRFGIALIFDPFDLFQGGSWPFEVRPVSVLNSSAAGASGAGQNGVPALHEFHIPAGANRALLVVAAFERDHMLPLAAGEEDYDGDGFSSGKNFAAPNFHAGDYTINARFEGSGGVVNQRNPLAFPQGDLRFTHQYLYSRAAPESVLGARYSAETYHIAIYESHISALLNGSEEGTVSISLDDISLPASAGDDAILMAFVFDNVEQSTRGITRSGVEVSSNGLSVGAPANWVKVDTDLDSLQEPDEPQDGFLAVGFNFLGQPNGQGGFVPTAGFTQLENLVTSNSGGTYNAHNDPDGISMSAEYRNGPDSGIIDEFTMAANGPADLKSNGGTILGFTVEAIGAGHSGEDDPFVRSRIPVDTRTYLIQTSDADIYSIDLLTGESWLLVDNSFQGQVNGAGFNVIDGTIWGYPNDQNQSSLVKYDGSFRPQLVPIIGLNPGNYVTGDINTAGLLFLKADARVEIIDLNPYSPSYLTSIGEVTLHPRPDEGFNFHDWAFSPVDGKLYTVNQSSRLIRVEPLTGAMEIINSVEGMMSPEAQGTNGAIFFDSDGHIYISDNDTGVIYKIHSPHLYSPGDMVVSTIFSHGPRSGINDGVRAPSEVLTAANPRDVSRGVISVDKYSFLGGAEFIPATGNILLAGPDPGDQTGAVWKKEKIDLSEDFHISADLYLGEDDSGRGGITLTIQDSLAGNQAVASDTNSLGIVPGSFGVYFKTWSEGVEPLEDHTAFYENGVIAPVGPPPVPILVDGGNVENGEWVPVDVIWNAEDRVMEVHVNGNLVQTIQRDVINTALNGSTDAYIGFTAAADPLHPNRYGVRVRELSVTDLLDPGFQLVAAEQRVSRFDPEGVILDPELLVVSDTPGALLDGASVRFVTHPDPETECLFVSDPAPETLDTGTYPVSSPTRLSVKTGGTVPGGGTVDGIEWVYHPQRGTLELRGEASVGHYQAVLRRVAYFNADYLKADAASHRFSVNLGSAMAMNSSSTAEDPRFYQIYSRQTPLTWNEAWVIARSKKLFGNSGYLATVTSAGENELIRKQFSFDKAWIGATDSDTDKEWRWVTGPEGIEDSRQGRHFFQQNGSPEADHTQGSAGGVAVNSRYANWSPNQPDAYAPNQPEDYAFINSDGFWSDTSLRAGNSIHYFVAEFGGLPGQPSLADLYAEINLHLQVADSDLDGIIDDLDLCAGTPEGTRVDYQGCPLPVPVAEDAMGVMETAIPLTISFAGNEKSEYIQILGLPDGSVLNSGHQTRSGFWVVPVSDLDNLAVVPPDGFSGDISLTIAAPASNQFLHFDNGTFGKRGGLSLLPKYAGPLLEGYTDFSYFAGATEDAQYTVTNWNWWKTTVFDRLEPVRGYFGVFDLDIPGVLVDVPVENLVPGEIYELAFWMANLNTQQATATSPIVLEAGFVRDGGFVAEYHPDRLPGFFPLLSDWEKRWAHHGFLFTADNTGTMRFQLRNLSQYFNAGNDIAVDSFSVRRLVTTGMTLSVLGQEIDAVGSTGFNTELLPITINRGDVISSRPFLVRGVPAGAELSHGSEIAPGIWIVGANHIDNLSVLVARNFHGPFEIQATQIGYNASVTGRDLGNYYGLELGDRALHGLNRGLQPRNQNDDSFGPDGTPIRVTYPPSNPDIVTTVIADAVEAIYEIYQAAHLTLVTDMPHRYSHNSQSIWGYVDLVDFPRDYTETQLMNVVDTARALVELRLQLFMATFVATGSAAYPPEWPLQLPVISSSFWAPANGIPAAGVQPLSQSPSPFNGRRLTGEESTTLLSETVSVEPGTDYTMTILIKNKGATPLISLSGMAGGTEIVSSSAIVNDGTWQIFVGDWNSGTESSVGISVRTTGPAGHGADLVVGEIDFSHVISASASMEAIEADEIAPVAVSAVFETDGATPVEINVIGLSYDNEGLLDPSSVTIIRSPSHGSISIDPSTGVITYTPSGDLLEDEFTYVISDHVGNVSNESRVIIAPFNTASAPEDLIGYWNFDETSGMVAKDSSRYRNDGILKNYVDQTSHWTSGQIGNGLSFGGPASQQFVLVPDYPEITTEMSLSVWVWTSSYQNYGTIIKNWGEGLTGQFHFDFGESGELPTITIGQPDSTPPLEPVNYRPGTGEGGAFLRMAARTNPGNGGSVVEAINPVPLSTWQHFVMVADGSNVILYQNGSAISSRPYNGQFNPARINALGIGAKLDDFGSGPAFETPGFFDGRMDDLAMWKRALTPDEVTALYVNGLAGKPVLGEVAQAERPAVTASPQSTTVTAGEDAVLSVEFSGSSPVIVQWFLDGVPIAGATGNKLTIGNASADDSGQYHVQITNQAGVAISSSARLDVIDSSRLDEALVGYWRFDEGQGLVSVDDSNNGYDAGITDPNAGGTWMDGLLGSALKLNGDAEGDFAMVSGWNRAATAVSVSAWVRADSVVPNGSIVRNWGDTEATGWFSLGFSGSQSRIANTTHFTTGELTLVSDVDLRSGQWVHVAVVLGEAGSTLYQNGEIVAQGPGGTLIGSPASFIGIGARPDDFGNLSSVFPQIWDGGIDDVAIWLRDLSSLEVQTLSSQGRQGQSLGELTGRLPVHITRHPSSVKGVAGLPLTLRVETTGPNVTYQWFRNGLPMPSQIGQNLTIDELAQDDAGNYQVMVSNIVGRKFSRVAVVEVLSPSTLGQDLAGYWPMDESRGLVARDLSLHGNHGQLVGYSSETSQWLTGKVGGALNFGGVGTGQFVLVPDYPKPTTGYTLSAWVQPASLDYDASIIRNWGDGTSLPPPQSMGQFQLGLASMSGELQIVVPQSAGSVATVAARDTGSPIEAGGWVHVMAVHDGSNISLYRDGQLVSSTPSASIPFNPLIPALGIGVRLNDSQNGPGWDLSFWNGLIDELTIWNRNLSDEEREIVYQLGQKRTGLSSVVAGIQPQSPGLDNPDAAVRSVLAAGSVDFPERPILKADHNERGLSIQWTPGFELEMTDDLANGTWVIQPEGGRDEWGLSTLLIDEISQGRSQLFFRIRNQTVNE